MALVAGAVGGRGTGVVAAQKSLDPMHQTQDPTQSKDPSLPSAEPESMPSIDDGIPNDGMRARMKEDRVKALNDSRHQRLEDDVTKLQTLTNELKSDVDKANKDELSLEVMRKAAEIEKLAHDVQSRMKN